MNFEIMIGNLCLQAFDNYDVYAHHYNMINGALALSNTGIKRRKDGRESNPDFLITK